MLLPEPVRWQRVEQRGGGGTTCVRPVSTFLALTHSPATLWDDGIFTEEEGGGARGDGGHLDFGQTSQRPARARGGEIPVFLVRRRVFGVTYKRSNIFLCDFPPPPIKLCIRFALSRMNRPFQCECQAGPTWPSKKVSLAWIVLLK